MILPHEVAKKDEGLKEELIKLFDEHIRSTFNQETYRTKRLEIPSKYTKLIKETLKEYETVGWGTSLYRDTYENYCWADGLCRAFFFPEPRATRYYVTFSTS